MVRLISGIALAAAALAAILFLPVIAVRVLACAVAALTAHEYLKIVHSARPLPGVGPWVLLVAATCWWMLWPGPQGVLWLVLVSMAAVAIEVLFRGLTIEEAGVRFIAPWYVGMPLGLLTAIHALNGAYATLLLIATV